MSVSIVDIAAAVVTLLNSAGTGTYLDGRGFSANTYDYTAEVRYQPDFNFDAFGTALKVVVTTPGSATAFDRSTDDLEERINVSIMKKLAAPVSPATEVDAAPWVKFSESMRDCLKQKSNRTLSVNSSNIHLRKIEINQEATPWLPEYLRQNSLYWSVLTLTYFHLEQP